MALHLSVILMLLLNYCAVFHTVMCLWAVVCVCVWGDFKCHEGRLEQRRTLGVLCVLRTRLTFRVPEAALKFLSVREEQLTGLHNNSCEDLCDTAAC